MDIDKLQDQLFQSAKDQNLLIFKEAMGISKLKNTWIAQIVTVAGALLGGLTIFSDNKNIVASFGLIILFSTIIFGLILIIKNINTESNRLMNTFSESNDYNLKFILWTFLEQKGTLTPEEENQKESLEKEIEDLTKKLGIINEDGGLNSLSKNLQVDKINPGNYILIFGLAIGGIFITLSSQIITFLKCLCYC